MNMEIETGTETGTGTETVNASTELVDGGTSEQVKKGSSDFTLEEKKMLVKKAVKEGYNKVAEETGITASMLYTWSFNLKHNRPMRSKKSDVEPKEIQKTEKVKHHKQQASEKKSEKTDKPSVTSAEPVQKKTASTTVSSPQPMTESYIRKRLSELEEENKQLKIENVVLKERENNLLGQVDTFREAMQVMIRKQL